MDTSYFGYNIDLKVTDYFGWGMRKCSEVRFLDYTFCYENNIMKT